MTNLNLLVGSGKPIKTGYRMVSKDIQPWVPCVIESNEGRLFKIQPRKIQLTNKSRTLIIESKNSVYVVAA